MFLRILLIVSLVAVCPARAADPQAAVAMPDTWSAQIAQRVLQEGGNAVDAAVAAAFVLAVTYPEAGNIGGGGFMTSFVSGEAAFLDFRERAPAAAHRDMYLDEAGNIRPGRSAVGPLACGVPGTVAGLAEAHRRYGTLAWKRLLQPAVELAREGFVVPPDLAGLATEAALEFDGRTNFQEYFGDMRSGERFVQRELAATLALIAEDPAVFYRGLPAQQLVEQMEAAGGLITRADLEAYRPVWREPLRHPWRSLEVVSAPPPSSGGIALLQLLHMRDFAAVDFEGLDHNAPAYIHLLAELEKRVFADRAEYLGDPDYVEVPQAQLLAADYLRRRAASIDTRGISPVSAVPPGLESPETTHFSILDGAGNAVSLTYTLNWDFGSGVVVPGAGFLLNNEMDDFSAKPGAPNLFGVVGSGRNAIAGGKRMLSSMTPTIVLEEDEPVLVLGTPGGSTIFTSVFQVILNLYDFDMPLQQAVDALRFHHQLPAARVLRHDRRTVPGPTRKALEDMGYRVEANEWGDLGDVQAIAVSGEGLAAATDARGRGEARVFPVPARDGGDTGQ